MAPRPTPFDLVFAPLADERFPELRGALAAAGRDPRDRDAFLMTREAVAMIHQLRPEEGLSEGIELLAALVHHAYLFWDAGSRTVTVTSAECEALLDPGRPEPEPGGEAAEPCYVQLPERKVWAQAAPGMPFEPLDGCFVHGLGAPAGSAGGPIRWVLGIFGLHPERMGFTVVEAVGPRPRRLVRPDNSPLFSSILPGGTAAGLRSLAGAEELLELGWRLGDLAAARGAARVGGG